MSNRVGLACVIACASFSLSACSLLVEDTLTGRNVPDAGFDAGTEPEDTGPPATACTGRTDGTFCEIEGLIDRLVCIDEICVVSACGDSFADTRTGHPSGIAPTESCDDGNPIGGDGCEEDCSFSCDGAADCADDGETCNGVPSCGPDHFCVATALANGTDCVVVDSGEVAGLCRDGACRAGECPNAVTEPGEDCDDDNGVEGDGCDNDCTFSCTADGDCQNSTVCDGAEACDLGTHICAPGAAPDCDDGDACTADSCNATMGCLSPSVLVDADRDGFAAITASCGGDDCNDANPAVNPRAVEGCGTTMDMNCDGMVTSMPTWYADCDRDGFARSGAQTTMACSRPTTIPSSCGSSGQWISLAPTTGSIDCIDTNSNARPGQTSYFGTAASGSSFNYDCNGTNNYEYSTNPTFFLVCQGASGTCAGSTFWDETRVPACGSTATRSYCSSLFGTCSRRTSESTVRCR